MNAFAVTGSSFGIVALLLSLSTICQALFRWFLAIRDAPSEIGSLLLQLGNTFARAFRMEACLVNHRLPQQSDRGPLSIKTYSDQTVLENAIMDLADMLIQLSEEFLKLPDFPYPEDKDRITTSASTALTDSEVTQQARWCNPVLPRKLSEMRNRLGQRDMGNITIRSKLTWVFKRKHLQDLARRLEYQQAIIASIQMTMLTEYGLDLSPHWQCISALPVNALPNGKTLIHM
ncbi:MAG: hypothetical protein M1836_003393 [Candelina mexicana]|nr:MAG: hypothetical protein M1836_003393 [Candelina mexicana]